MRVFAFFCLSVALSFTSMNPAWAGSDAFECHGDSGAAFGLCQSYCKALDCASTNEDGSIKDACEKIQDRYQIVTGKPLACASQCILADSLQRNGFPAVVDEENFNDGCADSSGLIEYKDLSQDELSSISLSRQDGTFFLKAENRNTLFRGSAGGLTKEGVYACSRFFTRPNEAVKCVIDNQYDRYDEEDDDEHDD